MTTKRQHYRQGDVLIELLPRIKPDQKAKEGGKTFTSIVLAHGEATGHAHVLELADSADWWKDGDTLLINCNSPAVATHQEHSVIEIKEAPEHTLRVTRQREYSPEEIRRVAD